MLGQKEKYSMDGGRLRRLRKQKGLTQSQLGKIINVSKVSISGYESGERTPDTDNLRRLADFFDVSTDYLLGRTDNPSSNVVKESEAKYDALSEIRKLTDKHGIDHLFFYDIEKWKAMGPEEIKQLDEFFDFLSKKAKEKNQKE